MARGWESKSVEGQLEAAEAELHTTPRARLSREQADQQRRREVLLAARARIAQQLKSAQNPRYRKLLEDELAALDAKLNAIG